MDRSLTDVTSTDYRTIRVLVISENPWTCWDGERTAADFLDFDWGHRRE